MKAPIIARALGIAFFAAGVLGFVPYVTVPHGIADPWVTLDANYVFIAGIFPVNVVHDGLHMLFGIWGIGASTSFKASVRFCRVVAWVYFILVVLGAIPIFNTLFGIAPIYGWDVLLHFVIALLALYGGYGAGRLQDESEPEPIIAPPPL